MEMSPDEDLIRTERTRSNDAIQKKDTATLASIWTTDYHCITSRNFQASGRNENRDRFASEFIAKPDVIYIRTPEKIEIFPTWKMAAENGTWVGRWTEKGAKIEISGTYYAKWHKLNGQWMIRAEIFTPLKCTGGEFCDQPPI
ncbi:MAG: nuclear transport factor 2 family protein [Cyclobacteriaceae bacterium]|nr:nuclear transport factor 2 family protein [Cyclobacteriaceae bacterium]